MYQKPYTFSVILQNMKIFKDSIIHFECHLKVSYSYVC